MVLIRIYLKAMVEVIVSTWIKVPRCGSRYSSSSSSSSGGGGGRGGGGGWPGPCRPGGGRFKLHSITHIRLPSAQGNGRLHFILCLILAAAPLSSRCTALVLLPHPPLPPNHLWGGTHLLALPSRTGAWIKRNVRWNYECR